MSYHIVVGGYRETFALLSFDSSNAKLKVASTSPSPKNASWIESSPLKSSNGSRVLYTVAENPDKGLAASLEIKGEKISITAQRETHGVPAHIHCMKDGSGVVAANFLGGSILFFPVESNGQLSSTSKSTRLEFPFTYKDKKAPNEERQDDSHPHQVVEGANGVLYVPDLGGDRVWVVEREGAEGLGIKGYLLCPPGSGPRHCVISNDGKHLYVLTELGSTVFIFSLENPSYPAHPLPDVEKSVVPDSVPASHKKFMDAAELAFHPTIPNVLYASNRGELGLKREDAYEEGQKVPDVPGEVPTGDAVAIILLSQDGSSIEHMSHVRTGCDFIRGMRVSPDGKFVALAGQKAGGVEVYAISGQRGDVWKLAAKNEEPEMVTDVLWL